MIIKMGSLLLFTCAVVLLFANQINCGKVETLESETSDASFNNAVREPPVDIEASQPFREYLVKFLKTHLHKESRAAERERVRIRDIANVLEDLVDERRLSNVLTALLQYGPQAATLLQSMYTRVQTTPRPIYLYEPPFHSIYGTYYPNFNPPRRPPGAISDPYPERRPVSPQEAQVPGSGSPEELALKEYLNGVVNQQVGPTYAPPVRQEEGGNQNSYPQINISFTNNTYHLPSGPT